MQRALRHLETHAPPGGHDPSLEDVAHLLGKPVADVERLLRHQQHMLSLDAPIDRDSGLTIADGIADDEARAPELLLHDSAIESSVAGWLAELNARQRLVIERRYGLNDCEVTTLEDLAAEIGVTRERVRQIQSEALDKLRAKLERRGYTKDRCSTRRRERARQGRGGRCSHAMRGRGMTRGSSRRSAAGAGSTSIARSRVATSASRSRARGTAP